MNSTDRGNYRFTLRDDGLICVSVASAGIALDVFRPKEDETFNEAVEDWMEQWGPYIKG